MTEEDRPGGPNVAVLTYRLWARRFARNRDVVGKIVRLDGIRQTNEPLAAKVAEQLYDNARIAAGLLEDPRSMLKRLNEILEQALAK